MESSSPFVLHHEFFYVFQQAFSFNSKCEHHVEEGNAGKKDRRRACGGKIEASEFDIKKFECESPVNSGLSWNSDLTKLRDQGETETKTQRQVGARSTESIHGTEADPSQPRLRHSTH